MNIFRVIMGIINIKFAIPYLIILLIGLAIASKNGIEKKNLLKPIILNYIVFMLIPNIIISIMTTIAINNDNVFILLFRIDPIIILLHYISYVVEIVIIVISLLKRKKADSIYSNEELFNTSNDDKERK